MVRLLSVRRLLLYRRKADRGAGVTPSISLLVAAGERLRIDQSREAGCEVKEEAEVNEDGNEDDVRTVLQQNRYQQLLPAPPPHLLLPSLLPSRLPLPPLPPESEPDHS